MRRNTIVCIAALAILIQNAAVAAADEGALQTSQDYSDANAKGAFDNRASANHFYQSAHHHHHMAAASGGLDAAMMGLAMDELAQAISTDQQAQTMARAAISGAQSASQQSAVNGNENVSLTALQEIANNPSPYASTVQGEFSSAGVNLAGLKSSNSGATPSIGPNPVANIPQPPIVGAPAAPGLVGSAGLTGAAINSIPARTLANDNGISSDKKPLEQPAGAPGTEAAPTKSAAEEKLEELTSRMAVNLGKVRKELGLTRDPSIRPKSDDIFLVVQKHYQGLSESGDFYGEHLPEDATPNPLDRLYPKQPEVPRQSAQEPKKNIGIFPSVD